MTHLAAGLEAIKSQHPEWQPWLGIIEVILDDIADPRWEAAIPPRSTSEISKAPLLARRAIGLLPALARSTIAKLFRTASRSESAAMATLAALVDRDNFDVAALLKISLDQDHAALQQFAATANVDAGAFAAVAALLPLPFLQACNRVWAGSVAPSWLEGYCPICGSWPAFCEVRGIERNRFLRCGRCGSAWQARGLLCPYCGMDDHKELASLVPENNSLNAVIECCKRCQGYVKTFTKLQGSKASDVIIDDLASVELDIAAAEQGYKRPQGAGFALHVAVVPG